MENNDLFETFLNRFKKCDKNMQKKINTFAKELGEKDADSMFYSLYKNWCHESCGEVEDIIKTFEQILPRGYLNCLYEDNIDVNKKGLIRRSFSKFLPRSSPYEQHPYFLRGGKRKSKKRSRRKKQKTKKRSKSNKSKKR